jgi:hypothetical protein
MCVYKREKKESEWPKSKQPSKELDEPFVLYEIQANHVATNIFGKSQKHATWHWWFSLFWYFLQLYKTFSLSLLFLFPLLLI